MGYWLQLAQGFGRLYLIKSFITPRARERIGMLSSGVHINPFSPKFKLSLDNNLRITRLSTLTLER